MRNFRLFFFSFVFFLAVMGFQNSAHARRLIYIEEFYKLYYWPLYSTKFDARRNLFWLEFALKAPFAPPIQALFPCQSLLEYQKYKILFKMHLNHLMARSCLLLAAQFDVHQPRWYQKPYKNQVIRSLEFAKYYYNCVSIYWKSVQDLAQEALKISPVPLDFPHWEDVAFRVRKNKINLEDLSEKKMNKVDEKIQFFKNL